MFARHATRLIDNRSLYISASNFPRAQLFFSRLRYKPVRAKAHKDEGKNENGCTVLKLGCVNNEVSDECGDEEKHTV